MNRKAQFGLDTMLSWMLFAFFLLFTAIALTITGCGSNKEKLSSGIATETGDVAGLRASEQLSAYLRTEMPSLDYIKSRIDWLEDRDFLDNSFDAGDAKDFLDEHPDVYLNRTYAGFISAAYYYLTMDKDERSIDAFDAVTKALFTTNTYSKSMRELNDGRLDSFYSSPTILVAGGIHDFIYEGNGELSSIPPLKPIGFNVWAIKRLPSADGAVLTVQSNVPHNEEEALPFP